MSVCVTRASTAAPLTLHHELAYVRTQVLDSDKRKQLARQAKVRLQVCGAVRKCCTFKASASQNAHQWPSRCQGGHALSYLPHACCSVALPAS